MDHNGARSNPRVQVELGPLGELHSLLLRRAALHPRQPRSAPPKLSPVLETVTRVLELTKRPMRAREIHAAAEQLAGDTLLWTSVKAALAAGAAGRSPRFQRVRYGFYQRVA